MTAFLKQCLFPFLTTFVLTGLAFWLLRSWSASDEQPAHPSADQRPLVLAHQCGFRANDDEDKSWFSQALAWVGL